LSNQEALIFVYYTIFLPFNQAILLLFFFDLLLDKIDLI